MDADASHMQVQPMLTRAFCPSAPQVATIHQPNSDITELFDDFMLLARGRALYMGRCATTAWRRSLPPACTAAYLLHSCPLLGFNIQQPVSLCPALQPSMLRACHARAQPHRRHMLMHASCTVPSA
jgi:hypothetical protein